MGKTRVKGRNSTEQKFILFCGVEVWSLSEPDEGTIHWQLILFIKPLPDHTPHRLYFSKALTMTKWGKANTRPTWLSWHAFWVPSTFIICLFVFSFITLLDRSNVALTTVGRLEPILGWHWANITKTGPKKNGPTLSQHDLYLGKHHQKRANIDSTWPLLGQAHRWNLANIESVRP